MVMRFYCISRVPQFKISHITLKFNLLRNKFSSGWACPGPHRPSITWLSKDFIQFRTRHTYPIIPYDLHIPFSSTIYSPAITQPRGPRRDISTVLSLNSVCDK